MQCWSKNFMLNGFYAADWRTVDKSIVKPNTDWNIKTHSIHLCWVRNEFFMIVHSFMHNLTFFIKMNVKTEIFRRFYINNSNNFWHPTRFFNFFCQKYHGGQVVQNCNVEEKKNSFYAADWRTVDESIIRPNIDWNIKAHSIHVCWVRIEFFMSVHSFMHNGNHCSQMPNILSWMC